MASGGDAIAGQVFAHLAGAAVPAWADGSASTANTTSGAASIVVDE